ncbi:hypothetical protein [Dictyobacter aurantiacus]|uniref:Uncharacterized protein n=1 Tax=Dictyobacter aurantiacus TaxID=1936993 RepID=A0A401ZIP1_9CHLR|nr:hypothetical protein [Dictyobacter aurantiacus]GCE06709.1 hypothetical protein KDAU_40380 [Dictyobacter aurantiacus]
MKFNNIFSTSNVRNDEQQPLTTVESIEKNVELNEEELQAVNGGYGRHFRHYRRHRHHRGYGYGYGWGWGWGDGCYGDEDYGDDDDF